MQLSEGAGLAWALEPMELEQSAEDLDGDRLRDRSEFRFGLISRSDSLSHSSVDR